MQCVCVRVHLQEWFLMRPEMEQQESRKTETSWQHPLFVQETHEYVIMDVDRANYVL